MSGTLLSLRSRADLLQACGHHPVVRFEVPDVLPGPCFALEGAVAYPRVSDRGTGGLALLGPAPAVGDLLTRLAGLGALQGHDHILLPAAARPGGTAGLRLTLGDAWEWMWCERLAQDAPDETGVIAPPDTVETRTEVDAFLHRVSPRTHARPLTARPQRWVGMRDEQGRLVATGAAGWNARGLPVLEGIAVEPSLRGRRLGAAVTAYLTRAGLADHEAVVLGLFSDNAPARRLYTRLGYRRGQRWMTLRANTAPSAGLGVRVMR